MGAAYFTATEDTAAWVNKYDLYVIQPWISTTKTAITNNAIKQRLQHENADIAEYFYYDNNIIDKHRQLSNQE